MKGSNNLYDFCAFSVKNFAPSGGSSESNDNSLNSPNPTEEKKPKRKFCSPRIIVTANLNLSNLMTSKLTHHQDKSSVNRKPAR